MQDLTSLWAFWQKYQRHTNTVLLLLVAFIAGWQISKITSPYTDATPIIFEECSDEVLSLRQENKTLETLKEEGIAAREPSKKEATTTQAVAEPAPPAAVAGTKTTAVSSTGKFVGSVNSDLFHDPSCSSSKRIKPANQIWFDSIPDAESAGYSPSKCTREKLGI